MIRPMRRGIDRLASEEFDLLIVGAGIYGACAAWDASLRGLRVALIDRGDFGGATSQHSQKTIHGGLRYLQQADLKRMRESIRERRTLMRIAPQFVSPFPCVMPTYGHLTRGREALAVAMLANDLVGLDRNRIDDPAKRIPRGRTVSRRRVLELLPGIPTKGLTGGRYGTTARRTTPSGSSSRLCSGRARRGRRPPTTWRRSGSSPTNGGSWASRRSTERPGNDSTSRRGSC